MTGQRTTLLATALWALAAAGPFAQQQTPIVKAVSVTGTATIQAINATTRAITLRTDKGEEDTFTAGPEIKRFDELKVGNRVRMTYVEALAFQLLKPGEVASGPSHDAALARAKSELPAGAIITQQTSMVTVKAVDPAVPSITVTTADDHVITRKITDKTVLTGVAPGDRIDITYTEALLTSVEPAN